MADPRIVIDASGLLFRYFFALPPLSNSKGEPTGALLGFVRFLFHLKEERPDSEIVVVLDGMDNKKRRRQLYPLYKEQRGEIDPALLVQLHIIPEVCKLFGVSCLALEGEEADDVIASVVAQFFSEQIEIFSFDKDLCQLVNDRVTVIVPNDSFIRLDPVGVQEKYGIKPEQIPAWLAMVGDASDGLPGVPGLGKKTAASLLGQYQTLEEIFLSYSKGKRACVLQEYREQARFMESFIHLICDIPLPKIDANCSLKLAPLRSWLLQQGFFSLLHYVCFFDPNVRDSYEVDPSALSLAIHPGTPVFFLRVSTMLTGNPLNGLAVSVVDRVWFWWLEEQSHPLSFLHDLFVLVKERKGRFMTYHAKDWDVHLLRQGIKDLPNWEEDLLLASYLLDSSQEHSMYAVLARLGDGAWVAPLEKKHAVEDVRKHCVILVRLLAEVQEKMTKLIKESGLDVLYRTVELPLARLLARMEFKGVFFSQKIIKELLEEIQIESSTLVKAIEGFVERPINLHSPKQVAEMLFSDLGMNPGKKTKSAQFSTNSEVLEGLLDQHPVISLLLRYRKLNKLQSTYLNPWITLIDPMTQRIYPSFDQANTVTGRLSCKSPNLQNVPVRGEWGSRIRAAIKAPLGYWLLSGDYQQMEICLMAHFSKDPTLCEAIASGKDIHCLTAAALWECSESEVSHEQRTTAKIVNFGILYGQTPFGLAKQIGRTVDEAEQFIERYFAKFPHVRSFIEECKNFAREHGFIKTLLGRKRYIPEINSTNRHVRAMGERFAINSLIQGTGADLVKLAMLSIDREIEKNALQASLVLQVHDELVFEVIREDVDHLKNLVMRTMQNIYSLDVLLQVSIYAGENWSL